MTFADSFIATVPNSKYLGVIIGNKLSFYEHIKLLESKVSRSCYSDQIKVIYSPTNIITTLSFTCPLTPHLWNYNLGFDTYNVSSKNFKIYKIEL